MDGKKGVYHINAVDEVTQWEIVVTVEQIGERFMIPALESLLDQFPFMIKGFHADNGSEYINRHVAKLLNALMIRLTKSRPRHSNDNALAESKNNSVVRKTFGYAHIPQKHAELIEEFNRKVLNPCLNFHRPCHFPTIETDSKGKARKRYRQKEMMTPYEKLKSLPDAKQYLKRDITFEYLEAIAMKQSDLDAWKQMQKARNKMDVSEHLRQMALFKVNTGCRDGEVCGLRWNWEIPVPHLDTSVFLIPGDYVKNRQEKLVVLNRIASQVIEGQREIYPNFVFTFNGKPVRTMNNSSWKTAKVKANLPDVRVHDLKHTFGRRLRAAGVPFETRQDLLGHKSGRIRTHYSAPELQELIDAANLLAPLAPAKVPHW